MEDRPAKIDASNDLNFSRAISLRLYISSAIKARINGESSLTFKSTQLSSYRAILHGTLNIQMVLFYLL